MKNIIIAAFGFIAGVFFGIMLPALVSAARRNRK